MKFPQQEFSRYLGFHSEQIVATSLYICLHRHYTYYVFGDMRSRRDGDKPVVDTSTF